MKRKHMISLAAALPMVVATIFAATLAGPAMAQAYPSKPIRMIVPFPAGGATDILARALSQKLGEKIGRRWWSTTVRAPAAR